MSVRLASALVAIVTGLGVATTAGAHVAGSTVRPFVSALELAPEDPSPGGQFVWLYNPSGVTIDFGCYRLRSTSRAFVVRPQTRVPAHSTVTFAPPRAWLRSPDQVELLNRAGRVVDRTPRLSDDAHDGQFWLKRPATEWHFGVGRTYGEEVVRGKIATAALESCKVN